MDKLKFLNSCENYNNFYNQNISSNSIGTLKEKTLHAIIKNYFEEHIENQEVKIGKYVADIVNENGIIEIQTANFNKLYKKLEAFLEVSTVRIVYPIPYTKHIIWIDEKTGEVSKKRKSPKNGSFYDAFFELYKIKNLLTHNNLKLTLLLINLDEYRSLNGWDESKKRGSSRFDRIPTQLVDELNIEVTSDFLNMIPSDLPKHFTSKDFKKASKLTLKSAQTALNILFSIGVVKRVGKIKNLYIYEKISYSNYID